MELRIPIKANYASGNAIALSEYEPGDAVAVDYGGTGGTTPEEAATALGFPRVTADNLFTGSNRPSLSNNATMTATGTFSFVAATHKQIMTLTLTGASTITFGAPAGIVDGAMYKWRLKAGDALARTFAWNVAFKFPGQVAPLTSGTINVGAHDMISFIGGPGNTLEYDGHLEDVR